jgi:hypothetical protein
MMIAVVGGAATAMTTVVVGVAGTAMTIVAAGADVLRDDVINSLATSVT